MVTCRPIAIAITSLRWTLRPGCDDAWMTHRYWPVSDLRLEAGRIALRPVTEADLVPLADLRPSDAETDPRLPTFGIEDPQLAAGVATHLSYWSSLGTWRPEAWRLGFAVRVGGVLAGVQELEADNFPALRVVETSSWLASGWRGQGVGRTMRLAVLALAFDGLGAHVAETSAWPDNAASLGVSRALGYLDNGVVRHHDRGRVADMPRLRLPREVWLERHPDHGVRVTGLDRCRHLFGLT
jgi:RimJ/RimL family protein N-acetyltransferase